MSGQHHDPGHKKRTAREHAAALREHNPTPDEYARNLVRRGLASKLILGGPGRWTPQEASGLLDAYGALTAPISLYVMAHTSGFPLELVRPRSCTRSRALSGLKP